MSRVALILAFWAMAASADPVRDPMRPPLASSAREALRYSEPAVTAVFIATDRRAAIVDGRVVHAGDIVGDCAIDAVLDDGIRFHRAGVVHELHLAHSGSNIKKVAALRARDTSGAP